MNYWGAMFNCVGCFIAMLGSVTHYWTDVGDNREGIKAADTDDAEGTTGGGGKGANGVLLI